MAKTRRDGQKEALALAVANGAKFDEAIEKAGVSERVGRAMLAESGFVEMVEQRTPSADDVEDGFRKLLSRAVDIKRDILFDGGASRELRNSVASEVLKICGVGRESKSGTTNVFFMDEGRKRVAAKAIAEFAGVG